MNTHRFTCACLISLVLAAAPASAAGITVSSTQSLGFGKFAAGIGGSVSVSTGGARSASGGVVLLSSNTGAAARFTVSGDANLAYSLLLPANGAVALSNGSGQTMPLSNFTASPSGLGQLSGAGNQIVSVGATLNVGSQQAPGSYSGTFLLIVEYN